MVLWQSGLQKSADAFSGLDLKKIPEALRSSAAYRKGFAEAEAGVYADAASSLTYFITQYPKDGNVAIALAQRGICYKSERDFTKALADFDRIIKEYPENRRRRNGLLPERVHPGGDSRFPGHDHHL